MSVMLILAAIAVPSFMSLRDRAKVHEAEQAMQQLRMAQALYVQAHPKSFFAGSTQELLNYTDITLILQNFQGPPGSLLFSVTNDLSAQTGIGYTVTALAKDSQNTPVTATESKVLP